MFAHKSIKKIPVLLLVIFTCAFLTSCTEESDADNYINDYAHDIDGTYENETSDDTIPNATQPHPQAAFTGEPTQRGDLYWSDERDRNWEGDIRHFAILALRHHPLLIEFDDIRFVEGRASESYSRYVHNAILSRAAEKNGILSNDYTVMRESLRELFIEKTNTLIINIPNFSDYEIIFSLSEISALLGDGHTHTAFLFGGGRVFPVDIRALYDGVYLMGVPKEFEHALYSELLAIGGVPIDEVVERFSRVVPHENEYYLRRVWIPRLLMVVELLMFIDVVCDSGVAEFSVRCTKGEIFDITLEALDNREAFMTMRETEFVSYGANTLMDMRPDELMWHEYFPEESIMYVRIRSYANTETVTAAAIELRTELRNWKEDEPIEKVIIDLRGNLGGHAMWPSGEDINFLAERVSNVYVIIDGGSYSQSVIMASNLRYRMDNVTIIGEPTGQHDNFFFGGAVSSLTNSRLRYQVSSRMWVGSNSNDTALRPDVLIPLTINDIINQHDPVLEYIFSPTN